MDLISVIVPVYNAEQYVDRCIESIINQTYSNFELLLIDDGSNDKSLEICNEWSNRDVRIQVYSKQNGGASSARNYGLDKANGEYVVFVDADDWISSKYIEFLHKAITLNDYDIVQCNLKSVENSELEQSEHVNFDFQKVREITKIEALNYRLYKVSVCAKIYRKYLFDDFKFREGAIYEDDASYYIFVYRAKKIAMLNETLYFYFMSSNSVMRNENTLDLEFIKIYKERMDYFKERNEKILLDGTIARFCLVLLLGYGSVIDDKQKREYLRGLYTQNYLTIRKAKCLLLQDKILFYCFSRFPNVCSRLIKFLRRLRK